MYQVAADLANRFCDEYDVHLVCAVSAPRDRFAGAVRLHPLSKARSSGMDLATLDLLTLLRVMRRISTLRPDVVHFVAPHIWNLPLVLWLRLKKMPLVYTLHDLDPHQGTRFSGWMRFFNKRIVHLVDQLFVYGAIYKERLIASGVRPERITVIPLLHLFLSYEQEQRLVGNLLTCNGTNTDNEENPFILFFGRLELYKGLTTLLQAWQAFLETAPLTTMRLIIAGSGAIAPYLPGGKLPERVEVRDHFISDDEAIALFSHCSLVVLPYLDATQSALIAVAYFFHKPVIVTCSGALPEYVIPDETGFIVAPGDAEQLAAALQTALSNPARLRSMGEAGYRWYQARRAEEYQTLQSVYTKAARHDT